MKLSNKSLLTLATVALASATTLENAAADAAVYFSSQVGATNLQSNGQPMDESFSFQIGAFANGFEPSADNTGQWLAHWVPLGDAAADPLPGATAPYESIDLPAPFPSGTTSDGFTGNVSYDHNEPPFTTMGAVYIWGYDNRQTAGEAEWILVTSSVWGWPSGAANPPAETFSMGSADSVILGSINANNAHMQTAAVTLQSSGASSYDNWLAANFTGSQLSDSALADSIWGVKADPDNDGIDNVIEYYTGSDPNDPVSAAGTAAANDGEFLIFSFYQSKTTDGVVGNVEWSDDMENWNSDSVATQTVDDLGDVYLIEARIPLNGAEEKFARLKVRRSFN